MRRMFSSRNMIYFLIFILSFIPNLCISYIGYHYNDIRFIFIFLSIMSGIGYERFKESHKNIPNATKIFLLFAASSSINSYIIRAVSFSNPFNPNLIGESLGASLVFTLVFGFWFFIGYQLYRYSSKRSRVGKK